MKYIKTSPMALLLGFLGLLLLVSCSGGGGTSSTSSTNSDSGTVALYLKDGIAEDYDEIRVTITKVALLPVEDDEEDAEPVVIFESQEGKEVDFLAYSEEPYLFLVDDTIPPGRVC